MTKTTEDALKDILNSIVSPVEWVPINELAETGQVLLAEGGIFASIGEVLMQIARYRMFQNQILGFRDDFGHNPTRSTTLH